MSDGPSLHDPADRRAGLLAARNVLAATIAAADPSNIASLVKQYRETLRELEELAPAEEVNPLDELGRKRTARLSPTSSDGSPARAGKRRTGSG